ncbi:MAG: MFS transporter [Actinomycetota bacterium]
MATRLAPVRALFGPRRFGRLITAQALSQTADGLYQIALASVLVFNVSAAKTPAQVTKLLAVTLLPYSVVGPFTGPFIDRFSRRSILVGTSVGRVVLTALLVPAIGWPEPVLLTLVVANMALNRFFHATRGAVLPTLVEPDQYLLGNAVSTTVGMVFGLSGAVVGGPITDTISPEVTIAVAAALIAGAAVAAATLPLPGGERRGLAGLVAELREDTRDVLEGLRRIRESPHARYAIGAIWSIRGLLGFILLSSLVVLRERFDIRATGASILFGAIAVGSFIGAVTVPAIARLLGRERVIPAAFLVAGFALLLAGPIPAWAALLASVSTGGFAMATTKITADTMIQRTIPDGFRGRAFAVYDIGYNGVFVLAALVPTVLRPFISDVVLVIGAGVLAIAAGGLFAARGRRLPDQATRDDRTMRGDGQ